MSEVGVDRSERDECFDTAWIRAESPLERIRRRREIDYSNYQQPRPTTQNDRLTSSNGGLCDSEHSDRMIGNELDDFCILAQRVRFLSLAM